MEAMKKPFPKIDSMVLDPIALLKAFLILSSEPASAIESSLRFRMMEPYLIDREIKCAMLDENRATVQLEDFRFKRQSSTSNMIEHLTKRHSIEAQDRSESAKKPKSTILTYFGGREKLSQQQLLEKNILQWIVTENPEAKGTAMLFFAGFRIVLKP
ncbi:hypothetical protein V1504DRAFT_476665 [Lipomyces starkeyi]